MKTVDKIKRTVGNPLWLLVALNNRGLHFLNDKTFLKLLFKLRTGKKLNLDNPKTFNEKLQWLKIYDRKDIYTVMVDKYEAKKYVANIIGEEYIIPTFGVYNKFDDIDFDKLPDQFVIKCTHDSGGLAICKNKAEFDFRKAKKKINKCLRKKFYYSNREWPYKNIEPRIIVEKYMVDDELSELRDYKFFCFNGVVKLFKIDFDRFIEHRANYYDRNSRLLRFGEKICPPDFDKNIVIPDSLGSMIKLAEKISSNIPFVRVDFYSVNGQIYFGEATFYPAAGFGKFVPQEWDKKLGDLIDLGLVKNEI